MKIINQEQITNTSSKKSLFLILSSSIGLMMALPVALAAVVIWKDSLARQLFVVVALFAITVFATKKEKYSVLTLGLLFLTQFATSLHTFDLAEPLRFQIYFLDIIILLLFISSAELRIGFSLDKIGAIWLLMILWMFVTSYFSARTDKSILFVIMMIKSFTLYVIFRNIKLDEVFIKKIVAVVTITLVIQGLIAGLQFVKNAHLGLMVIGERDPGTSQLHYVKDSLRVSGTLGAVNAFGGYIAMLMVFLTPFVLAGKKNKITYLIYGFSFITLIIPFSRSGWLSYFLGAGLCILNLLRSRNISFGKALLLGIFTSIFLIGSAFVFRDKIQDRFEDREAVASAEGRVGQFYEAMDVVERYPMLGIGPGITEFFGAWKNEKGYVARALPGVNMANQYHNNFLQFWVENGVLGAMLFGGFMLAILFSAISPPIKKPNISPLEKICTIGASAAAFTFIVHSSFGPEINNERLLVAFAIFLGLARNKQYLGKL